MGQRLVISVDVMGDTIAKLYYHWSAYTESALYETQKVVDCIYNHEDETVKELQLRLIRLCEANGGGIRGDDEEQKYIRNMFPNETFKTDGYSRSYGLIALSKKGMQELQDWSEGDVTIDIDEDLINFGVYAGGYSLEEYIENRKEWDDEFEGITLEEIPNIEYDLGWINVEDLDDVAAAIEEARSDVVRYDNEIYELTC